MFSFGKKKEKIKVTDIIFMTAAGKWHACMEATTSNSDVVFIAWFTETQRQLEAFFIEQKIEGAEVLLAVQATPHAISGRQVIFAEHYPLREKEETFYSSAGLNEAKVFSSLEDTLFRHFGGSRVAEVMEKMGVQENEPVQHPMIAMALTNAQEKIAAKILIDQAAASQEEWLGRNLGTGK